MGLRDILLFGVVLVGIPLILRRPYIGILYWAWFGLMNPHRLAYGPAFDFPFAQLIAVATFAGLFLTKDERRWKGGPEVYILIALIIWMSITTLQALEPDRAVEQWNRVIKVQVMSMVALLVLCKRRHVELFVWVMALSVGFFGVKGGIFTILTGGNFHVFGPDNSPIADNTSLALAIVMVIPLFYHLQSQTSYRWVRIGLVASMILCAFAALGTQSRGALLAIGAMAAFLWLHSRNKLLVGLAILVTAPLLLQFMPEKWSDRMNTIVNYEGDGSANGRLMTWKMLYRVANDRFMGGGFEPYSTTTLARYLPEYDTVHSAHSIYFQFLGEHGWIGLLLFLSMWFFVWRTGAYIMRVTRGRDDLRWASSLSSMLRVSLVGYLVGGAFLNLGYWDFPYYTLVLLVVVRDIVRRQLTAVPQGERIPQQERRPEYGVPASVQLGDERNRTQSSSNFSA